MKGLAATSGTRRTGHITRTGVELGLDIGIAQLGISTDYGGGIVVGIGGQKIIWGREGGKIHYNLGGFEVLVEARNCVVVETKKIAGIVVAIRTYPDPGCKPPEPPEPPEPPKIPDPPGGGIGIPNDDEIMWVIYTANEKSYRSRDGVVRLIAKTIYTRTVTDLDISVNSTMPPFVLTERQDLYPRTVHKIAKNIRSVSRLERIFLKDGRSATGLFLISNLVSSDGGTTYQPTSIAGGGTFGRNLCYFGPGKEFNKFKTYLDIREQEAIKRLSETSSGVTTLLTFEPTQYIPLIPKKFKPFLLTGNQPPMPASCCEALQADLEDIKKVLATKEILAGKLTFPWELRMPGGKGEEVIMDYPNLARAIAQMIDHLGIHPPKLSIKDINNAIAGDQSLNNQFPSATKGFEALMAQIWDANADVDTLTNFLYRLSWLNVQQSMNMAQMSAKVECLIDMLGGETEPSETTITFPFNMAGGIKNVEKSTSGKGFGKNTNTKEGNKINLKIDVNTEIATESLLPDFLKSRENPITVERFTGGTDINDKLDMLIMMIESLRRGQ